MSNAILVFGASGTIGVPLVHDLLARGESVQTASRSGRTVEGAKGVKFDFGSAADFKTLLEDVNRIFLLLPTGQPDAVGTLSPVIEAAAARKVKIVYLSALGADAHPDQDHFKVETILKSSGTTHVSLRPNWFADNFHTFWKSDVLRGNLRLPAAQGKLGFIDARDIAACAAAALTSGKFDGGAFTITGPESLTYTQAAKILSTALKRTIKYTALTVDEYVKVRTSEGFPAEFARALADFFAPVRDGETAVVTNSVLELTGQPPRTLAVYARDHVADLTSDV